MAPLAKTMTLSPPGCIGLRDDDAIVMFAFNESSAAIHPKDSAGAVGDLADVFNSSTIVDALTGKGRDFIPGDAIGMSAKDITPGASLLTRDVSIQAIVSWRTSTGTIVARGLGTGASEFVSYALEIAVVDAPSFTAQVRWLWQDTAGVLKVQTGAQFVLAPDSFAIVTATRRWVSPTKVVISYYVGDQAIGQFTSTDGSIGGGTTGTFCVGTRFSGGAFANFYDGVIDQVMVVGRELTPEEIEDTWLRISLYQPLGVQLFRENHDDGFPISAEPSSDAQLDIRIVGQALGFAASLAERLRSYTLPHRAFGEILTQWEEVTRVTPAPADSVQQRRDRVLARLRQRRGSSIDGLRDVLRGVIGLANADTDLQFLAFDNTITEDFSSGIRSERWDVYPGSSGGTWTVVSGAARGSVGGLATHTMDGGTRDWITMRQSVGGDAKQAHAIVKLAFTGSSSTYEAGIYFSEEAGSGGDFLLLGLRNNAGTFQVVTESFLSGVSQGLVVQASIGALPNPIWLHLYQTTTNGQWKAGWSTTSGTSGFTESGVINHSTRAHWSGCYVRGTSSVSGVTADFDDHVLRAPFGRRPYNAYVLLDSSLGFSPDRDGAVSVIKAVKHAFVKGTFITSRSVKCDNSQSGCDAGPMGGI